MADWDAVVSRIVIWGAPYTERSAGCVCLHRLMHDLIKLGLDARMYLPEPGRGDQFCPRLRYKAVVDLNEVAGSVLVYPEIITGHPLADYHPRKVVRWLLNGDGILTGRKMEHATSDLLVTHSRMNHPTAMMLRTPFIDRSHFNMDGAVDPAVRTRDLGYVGRGNANILAGTAHEIIGSGPPVPREDLAARLKKAKYLWTVEPFGALAHEAFLCGCAVRILDCPFWMYEDILKYEYGITFSSTSEPGTDQFRYDMFRLKHEVMRDETRWPCQLREFASVALS